MIKKHNDNMRIRFANQSGQAVVVLLLTLLVALGIGAAIARRSTTDVTTSTQTEQSSRAFSAAEAGIEQALKTGQSGLITQADLGNDSKAETKVIDNLPLAGQALEYPKIGKENFAQVWLVAPSDFSRPYTGSVINVYWGDKYVTTTASDAPAIEVNIVTKDATGNYVSNRRYYDPNTTRAASNGFQNPTSCNGYNINTSFSENGTVTDRFFKCGIQIGMPPGTPYMLRMRILHSTANQPIAVEPQKSTPCSGGVVCAIPPQISLISSIGTAGQSQKTVQVFRQVNVAPLFFDHAVFSAPEIAK